MHDLSKFCRSFGLKLCEFVLPYFDFDEARVRANYETVNPGAPLFRISSRTGDGIQELADFISEQIRKAQS